MTIEIKREGEVTYAKPLARALFRDARLSFGARGLFAFLWDLPDGWLVCLSHVAKMGPDGRDSLRSRMHELQSVGAVRVEAIRKDKDGNTIPGGRVAGKRWVLVAPDRWAVAAPLTSSPDRLVTESGVSPLSGEPIMGNPDAKVLQGSKGLQAEAAPRAIARNLADAAGDAPTKKRRIERDSGIVTWLPDDSCAAEKIEAQNDAICIAAAVAAVSKRGKEPVPGLVARELHHQRRERDAAECRAATEVARQARLAAIPGDDPQAMASGQKFLDKLRHKATHTPGRRLIMDT